jgi:hypothetical protein
MTKTTLRDTPEFRRQIVRAGVGVAAREPQAQRRARNSVKSRGLVCDPHRRLSARGRPSPVNYQRLALAREVA